MNFVKEADNRIQLFSSNLNFLHLKRKVDQKYYVISRATLLNLDRFVLTYQFLENMQMIRPSTIILIKTMTRIDLNKNKNNFEGSVSVGINRTFS